MNLVTRGRDCHPQWIVVALPLFCLAISGCRERIPSGPEIGLENPRFALPLNSYHRFDNWKLDLDGFRIPASKFHSAWRITDTSATIAGFSHNVIVSDSTFAKDTRGGDSLVNVRNRYFRTSSEGDVFELGFVAHLIEEHDTVAVEEKWDKIFSPSTTGNASWIVEPGDSSNVGNVYAVRAPSQELVGTMINGVPTGVLAWRVEVTGNDLVLQLWVSSSPSALLRFLDDSPGQGVRIYQELTTLQYGP